MGGIGIVQVYGFGLVVMQDVVQVGMVFGLEQCVIQLVFGMGGIVWFGDYVEIVQYDCWDFVVV